MEIRHILALLRLSDLRSRSSQRYEPTQTHLGKTESCHENARFPKMQLGETGFLPYRDGICEERVDARRNPDSSIAVEPTSFE